MEKSFPKAGYSQTELLQQISNARKDDIDWQKGRAFGIVYYLDEDLLKFSTDMYTRFLSESASKPHVWPSIKRFEDELIDMVSALFHGNENTVGTVTSGGTESIFLAVKSARDWARSNRSITGTPEIVAPQTAHPGFDRTAQYLGLKVIRVPVESDFTADVHTISDTVTENTIMLAASAPSYPHGIIDPIDELGKLVKKHELWFHVDACHGFLSPFIKKLGHPIPEFDLSVPGVTTLSVDLHKWGFAPKGASILLHRHKETQTYQRFEFDNWHAGQFKSLTFTGTRTGGAVAAAWAVMKYLGEEGYLDIARSVMDTKKAIVEGINSIEGLQLSAESKMGIITFGSPEFDIFTVANGMDDRKWYTARIKEPPGIHLVVTPANSPVVDEFLTDLKEVTDLVKAGQYSRSSKTVDY